MRFSIAQAVFGGEGSKNWGLGFRVSILGGGSYDKRIPLFWEIPDERRCALRAEVTS